MDSFELATNRFDLRFFCDLDWFVFHEFTDWTDCKRSFNDYPINLDD